MFEVAGNIVGDLLLIAEKMHRSYVGLHRSV